MLVCPLGATVAGVIDDSFLHGYVSAAVHASPGSIAIRIPANTRAARCTQVAEFKEDWVTVIEEWFAHENRSEEMICRNVGICRHIGSVRSHEIYRPRTFY